MLDESVVFFLVGVGNNGFAIAAVNGANIADGLNVRAFLNGEREIILASLAHKLLQFFLTLLGVDAAANDGG